MILPIRSHSQGRATEEETTGSLPITEQGPALPCTNLRNGGTHRPEHGLTMISIIDDDVCAREATAGIIRSLGYAFATYASAEEFLGPGHVNNTSCLITDVHLPGLSGVELYQRLRGDGFAAPTIFVTGHPDETTRTQVLSAGAVAFLSKPFGKRALLDCLRTASLHRPI
jgi:FixJ family two-component response regulator